MVLGFSGGTYKKPKDGRAREPLLPNPLYLVPKCDRDVVEQHHWDVGRGDARQALVRHVGYPGATHRRKRGRTSWRPFYDLQAVK